MGNGIHCIGSSPDITDNTITGNHENGIKLAVYFGSDDSPSTYDDDVLSDGTAMAISGNTIGGNGLEVVGNDIGAGIYAIDTPLGDISSIYSANTWSGDDDVCHIQQDWYGYVKVVDQDGNGITGLTVIVEQGGDASGWGWTYTFTTYDSQGNYGPSGFDVDQERTYQAIVEKRVKNDGTEETYTPQLVYIQGTTYQAEYAYDGDYVSTDEIGGAIESPPGSGWDRYQYAQLTKLSASPHAGSVVINEILYRETCDLPCSAAKNDEFIELYFRESVDVSGWTLSDGNIVNGDCDCTGTYPGCTGCIGDIVFTFPAGSVFNAGDYVVIWVGEDTGSSLKDAPHAAAQYYLDKPCKLRNGGDDIWLFDADKKLVDYVAYGSDYSINDQSYLPPGFWDGNNAPGGAAKGQSISLTPNGEDTNSGLDWELTTSDTAPGPITRDTDDLSCDGNQRVSSVGMNNNAAPELVDPKVDELYEDRDGNGAPSPGDILKYTVTIGNAGTDTAKNVVFSDTVDPHTSLFCADPYAPSTTKGTVSVCNAGPGGRLTVEIGDLAPSEGVTIVFYVEIVDYVEEVANQGLVTGSNFPDDSTDDPDTDTPDDPTVTKLSCNAHDLNGDCILDIRDVRIAYKIAMGCFLPTDEQRRAADVDGDGDVDMDDVDWYARWVLGGGG